MHLSLGSVVYFACYDSITVIIAVTPNLVTKGPCYMDKYVNLLMGHRNDLVQKMNDLIVYNNVVNNVLIH